MAAMNKEKSRTLLKISLALLIWQFFAEWTKLLIPFVQWEIKPSVSMATISLINGVGNGVNLIGSLFLGTLLERLGFRWSGVLATATSGLLILASSQTELLPVWLAVQLLRLGDHFKQICEAHVAWLCADASPAERTARLLRLSIPMGLALVLGPLCAVQTIMYTQGTRFGLALAGVGLFVLLLPVLLFVVPEPSGAGTKTVGPRLPSLGAYAELLRSTSLKKLLCYKLLIEAPFQAFDTMGRTYMVFFLVQQPAQLAFTIGLAGGTVLFTSLVLIKFLQRFLNPLQVLQASLAYLTAVYAFFGPTGDTQNLVSMIPMQMIGVSVALSSVNGQILNSGGKEDMGKLASLSQLVTLAAMTAMPFVAGNWFESNNIAMISYVSAGCTAVALLAVSLTGQFLTREAFRLPDSSDKSYRD